MRCHPQYAGLCRRINDSLCPYAETPCPLSKTNEKHLLITLSQVSSEIRDWEGEQGGEQSSGDCHDCLSGIVSILVTFLTVESQFVRHATSNVLVLISNHAAESVRNDSLREEHWRSKWAEFLCSLCSCLEVAMSNIVSLISETSDSDSGISLISESSDSDSGISRFILCIRERLANANWYTVAALIQVLRTIPKYLKQQDLGELLEIYMNSVTYYLTNIHWESLNEFHVAQSREALTSSRMSIFHHGRLGCPASRFVFLGALLQLLCSLVHHCSPMEAGSGTLNKHPVLEKITLMIPKIFYWCLHKQEDNNVQQCQYFRHKMLMLMIRLSFQVHQENSAFLLLFQLVQENFKDLLHLPISKHTDVDECLEGSPFMSCFAEREDVHSVSTSHLQRQAIFLFLKCAFSLISFGEATDKKCSCATSYSCLKSTDHYCCSKKKVLLDVSEWLQRHVCHEMFDDAENFLENCRSFTLSFLQLYMDEDDLLFEVLLHLSNMPFLADQMEYKEKRETFEEAKGNAMFLFSNTLNPVHLFHLFLAELHYDHLVLLDYLISKDTGIRCLQYLLRSLRTVRNSWHLFVEFPLLEVESSRFSCKKRKVSVDNSPGSDGEVELSYLLPNVGQNAGVFDKGSKRNNCIGSIVDKRKCNFEKAKECLLSLKQSVENLHQKNLFIYNPAALLRSFTRFEEMCLQPATVDLLKTRSIK